MTIVRAARFGIGLLFVLSGGLRGADFAPEPASRKPIAVVHLADRDELLVANERGSLSVVDTESMEVVAEHALGDRLVAMQAIGNTGRLAVVDGGAGELMTIAINDAVEVVSRIEVLDDAAYLRLTDDGMLGAVSARWSESLTLVQFSDHGIITETRQITLPFPPLCTCFLPDGSKLLVADAFGGQLAVLDVESGEVDSVRTLRVHNIRGMVADDEVVTLSCQRLNPLARSDFDDLHWGSLLVNGLRIIPISNLLDPATDLTRSGELEKLGEVGNASGDPGRLKYRQDGRMVVAMSGVAQVGFGRPEVGFVRVDVGARPVDVAIDEERDLLYVANQHDDSISVVDPAAGFVKRTILLGPPTEATAIERGERLFYDARLSHDQWMSCHTCHSDGHTIDQLADTLGDGDYGTPKRIPSLLGCGDTAPYAWNGSLETLDAQVRKSMLTTMHGLPLSDEQASDLTAFLASLSSAPPRADDAERIARGADVFAARRCGRCHTPPTYTSADVYSVGLEDERQRDRFNPPSLRGVGRGRALFHDGRATSLEDVFRGHRHQVEPLSDEDLADLVAFLRSL